MEVGERQQVSEDTDTVCVHYLLHVTLREGKKEISVKNRNIGIEAVALNNEKTLFRVPRLFKNIFHDFSMIISQFSMTIFLLKVCLHDILRKRSENGDFLNFSMLAKKAQNS